MKPNQSPIPDQPITISAAPHLTAPEVETLANAYNPYGPGHRWKVIRESHQDAKWRYWILEPVDTSPL